MKRMRARSHQREGLRELLSWVGMNEILGAEVGSFAGESAQVFLESGRFTQLFCVDTWTGKAAKAEPEFDALHDRHSAVIRKLKSTSLEAAPLFADGILDFVYIDADHRYESVSSDIAAWRPKIRSGGVLAGHDLAPRFPGVERAVREAGGPDQTFRDGSWAIRLP